MSSVYMIRYVEYLESNLIESDELCEPAYETKKQALSAAKRRANRGLEGQRHVWSLKQDGDKFIIIATECEQYLFGYWVERIRFVKKPS